MTIKTTIATMLTAAAVALGAPALAQDDPAVPEIAAEDVSTGQVVSFVNAMIALERIRRDYQPRMEAAETEEERKALAEEADVAAKAAIDKVVGISPGEYLAIGRAAQQNEDLANRINARIAQLRQNQQKRITPDQPDALKDGAEEPAAE